jgi:3-dehydroquinate synthase
VEPGAPQDDTPAAAHRRSARTLEEILTERADLRARAAASVQVEADWSITQTAARVLSRLIEAGAWRRRAHERLRHDVHVRWARAATWCGSRRGFCDRGREIADLLPRPRTWIVTERTVADLHLETLQAGSCRRRDRGRGAGPAPRRGDEKLGASDRNGGMVPVAEGRTPRRGVAFGGGVIGDLVGFAAAILRRGVRFVQVPTSLLAQVDSSVGGKTGINTGHGKNLVGAFHQPSRVLADIDVLGTLTSGDFLAGYGEVAKYGLLGDAAFFDWLEANGPALAAGDTELRAEAIRRSVQMKADIVARDETEQGDRALLNLGHTFGHALEAATGYSDRLLHGEGVAIGCALAFELSARLGLCAQEDPSRVRAHLADMKMKRDLSDIPGELPDADGLLSLMAQDKKVVDGQLRFILARGIGEAFRDRGCAGDTVRAVLAEALAQRAFSYENSAAKIRTNFRFNPCRDRAPRIAAPCPRERRSRCPG